MKSVEEQKKENTWPSQYTSTLGLPPYIRRLRKEDVTYVEAGTGNGEGLCYVLEQCPNIKSAYTIDPYLPYVDWNGKITKEQIDASKELANINFTSYGTKINCVRSFKEIPENLSIDVLYIDADNSYNTTYTIMKEMIGKVSPEGIVAVHNARMGPVSMALTNIRREFKQTGTIHTIQNNTWFWYTPKG
jgi:predicted O-methyltransferase YrrM